MKEITGDLWELAGDAICITTNGTVRNGENIMGGGCAYEAAIKYPGLPKEYARLIESHGHHVYPMRGNLVMFPTKARIQDRASLMVIMQSCYELMILADVYEWQTILLPRPGCGVGGLKWGMVRNVIKHILDDRVTVVGYPREDDAGASEGSTGIDGPSGPGAPVQLRGLLSEVRELPDDAVALAGVS